MREVAPEQLSEREREVAEQYVEGRSYKEIARTLGISPATVRTHINGVYRKLEVTSRIELLHRLGSAPRPMSAPFLLPDKPSLAVLPFANMSGDPEQEYFSNGISEDLTTDLSKISGLFVLARNSIFALKGEAIDVHELGSRLGVRYVVEGSVRKSGQRVRITAQLVDTATSGHLWAERYDRELTDIFAVQDEITAKIIGSLKVALLPTERRVLASHTIHRIEA